MPKILNHNYRLFEIDLVRASAILLMVFTHVFLYFGNWAEPGFNGKISLLGGLICFPLFFFASGATLPVLVGKYTPQVLRKKLWQRALYLLIVYYILAFIRTGFKTFWSVILWQTVPELVDFLFPFIAINFLAGLLVFQLKTILKRKYIAVYLLSGLALYLLGSWLYRFSCWNFLLPLKSLLAGHLDWHRFPLFQYALFYLVGLVYVLLCLERKEKCQKFIVFGLLGSILLYFPFINISWQRWPPNIKLISYALIWIFIIITFYYLYTYIKKKITIPKQLNRTIHFWLSTLSKNAFGILIIHTLILSLYDLVYYRAWWDNSWIVWVSYLIILLLSLGISLFFRQKKSLKTLNKTAIVVDK